MPYTYSVDSQSRMAYVRGSGPMDLEESMSAPVELSACPDFQADFGVVVDLRDMEFEPNASDLMEMSHHLIRVHRLFQHRVALVVNKSLSIPAEISAAIAGAGGFPLRVFTCPDEANEWASARSGPED
jgi:hypothetical protein